MWSCPYRRTRRTRAFTLIELVVATALAASIMAALLGVLSRLAHRQDYRPAQVPGETTEERLWSLIEHDLVNARTIQVAPDGIHLNGLGGLDPRTGQPAHLRSSVLYTIRKADKEPPWLVRQETTLSGGSKPQTKGELVYRGLERIAVSSQVALSTRPAPDSVASGPMPEAVRVTLVLVEDDKTPKRTISRVFYLR